MSVKVPDAIEELNKGYHAVRSKYFGITSKSKSAWFQGLSNKDEPCFLHVYSSNAWFSTGGS